MYKVFFLFLFFVQTLFSNDLVEVPSLINKPVIILIIIVSIVVVFALIFLSLNYKLRKKNNELILTEKKLIEVNESLVLATDAVNMGIWEWDLKDKIVWNNHLKAMFGLELDSKVDYSTWRNAVDSKQLPYLEEQLKNAIEINTPYSSKYLITRKNDNKKCYMQVSGVVLRDKDGNAIKFIGVNFDITKEEITKQKINKAKKKAEKMSEAKSNFLANMSHEIRTPMNGIIGLADLLMDTDLNKNQREHMSKLIMSSKSLLDILNDILDYSKIEAGKLDIIYREFNLDELLKNINNLFEFNIKEKNLEYIVNIDENLSKILRGDSLRISQILANLISNAIKFTNEGQITIDIKTKKNNSVEFSIIDTGIGISKENQIKLFESFNQADNSITRKYGGTGLGLAISKQLVELMKGEIFLESKENVGSKFTFVIPLKDLNSNEKQIINEEIKNSSLLKNDYQVLLIEDEEINQIVAKGVIAKFGLKNIDIANNGLEGLEKVKRKDYDIIFMDIQMPTMDGYEATKQIRMFNKNIPIIGLSAAVMQKDKEKSLNSGMNEHIAKPINKEELHKAIKRYLIYNLPIFFYIFNTPFEHFF